MKNSLTVLSIITAVTLCGCSEKEWYESTEPPSAEKIARTNKVRRELGLREIKDDWKFEVRTTNEGLLEARQKVNKQLGFREIKNLDEAAFNVTESWKDNMGYTCKRIVYNKHEEITMEADFYYGGRSFAKPDSGSPAKECLTLIYNYRRQRYMVVVDSDNEEILSLLEKWRDTDKTNEQNLWFAEKILKIWGLQRL